MLAGYHSCLCYRFLTAAALKHGKPRGFEHQIVALGEVCRFRGSGPVVPNGALVLSGEFQQVGSDGVKAVVTGYSGVGAEGVQQF
jgi:hypothetical protein